MADAAARQLQYEYKAVRMLDYTYLRQLFGKKYQKLTMYRSIIFTPLINFMILYLLERVPFTSVLFGVFTKHIIIPIHLNVIEL